ncbi:MAG TPA: isoleucine--tRNA ligase [Candidatus Acidoferrales bacterium]|jgi:isoleucyl-tRNA synthetase|nr:isoleucine--tRNA ligase [Candidatus Acidoferrales bacterium]
MATPGSLKSTLNLPRTDFPMKANLPQNEPRTLAHWETSKLYDRIQEARKGRPAYVLHDGPPYPTGTIHLGTALNKILKDMVVKSKSMAGFRAPYVPGWDCHGLPIETQVEKELGGKKGRVAPAEFRRICREFALRYVDQHRRDFKRLGVLGRWEDPYLTMSKSYEACIADAFISFLEKGYVYRGLKPVYWCLYDRTALAEAEVEYENHTSPSIWVRYPVVELPARLGKREGNVFALVWTTTPWTLPASMALAFNRELNYTFASDEAGNTYILAEQLLHSVMEQTGLRLTPKPGPILGRALEHSKFQHPFLDRVIPGVLGEHVTLEQGSGIVHTAPGHGAEDFAVGQQYGLQTYAPLDDDGRFTEGLPEYRGKTVFEANPAIIELLKSRGNLVGERKLQHSYPHCWRCHNPVIFRATEQWFIQMDNGSASVPAPKAPPLRKLALGEIPKVKWTPEWGQERIHEMIAHRPDWCISRQRVWGVPLIIFYCDKCGNRLEDFAALRHVVGWFEKEGADAWYTHSAEELLPKATACSCGSTKWRKENDILDVWFDSGSSHLAVLDPPGTPNADLPWPANMYLEGPDQYRGWFHSSLLIAAGIREHAPYRQVLTHGWTLDEQGRPMSKSLGNVILPTEICEQWGADLLRLWVASQDYHSDVRISKNVMTQLSEAYFKIRNTFRFALGNLFDFNPSVDAVPEDSLEELDRWMLGRTKQLVAKCLEFYESFDFHRVYHALYNFCVVDLSAFYFDILKDRLYTFSAKGCERRSAQTAIYRIASGLARLFAPILVFTTDEIWKHLPKESGAPAEVHLTLFPRPEECSKYPDEALEARWSHLIEVRDAVLKSLEQARNAKEINSGLEARVELASDGDLASLLRDYADWLPTLFIVSQVDLVNGNSSGGNQPSGGGQAEALPGLKVTVQRARGKKCERCWNYSVRVGEDAKYPTLCERCVPVLREIEGAAGADGANR